MVRSASLGGGGERPSHVWSLRGGLARTAYRPMDSAAALDAANRRLRPEQAATVRELTADVAARFYAPLPAAPVAPPQPRPQVTLPSWVGHRSPPEGGVHLGP